MGKKVITEAVQTCWLTNAHEESPRPLLDINILHYIYYIEREGGTKGPGTKPRQKCYDTIHLSNQVCVQIPETQKTSRGASYNSFLQQQSRRLVLCHINPERQFPLPKLLPQASQTVQKKGNSFLQELLLHMRIPHEKQV